MSYSKLHRSLVSSSLWTEPDHVRILFITLLAMADRDGCVYGSRLGIERIAAIDYGAGPDNDPWLRLMAPDPDSSDRLRSPEHEGRRLEEIPGGFRLLNYAYYRGLRNDDDRAEQNRLAQERFRAKSKQESADVSQDKPESATISPGNPMQRQRQRADAEASPDRVRSPSARPPYPDDFEAFWQAYPWVGRKAKAKAVKLWARLSEADRRAATERLVGRLEGDPKWVAGFIQNAVTYLGPGRHWEDDWCDPSAVQSCPTCHRMFCICAKDAP